MITKLLIQFAMDNGCCMGDCIQTVQQFKCYIKGQEAPYNQITKDPKKFWGPVSNELGGLAKRVINIIPHSASVERLFSRMAYAKNKWQNRMAKETLTNSIKIKMFLRKKLENKKNNTDINDIVNVDDDDNCDLVSHEGNQEDTQEQDEFVTDLIGVAELEEDDIVVDNGDILAIFNYNMVLFLPPSDTTNVVKPKQSVFTLEDVLKEAS